MNQASKPPEPIVDLPGEEWKPVPGYAMYRVSTEGRVYSHYTGRLLASRRHRDGYIRHAFSDGEATRDMFAHTAVLLAFVGPAPEGMECCHVNDVRDDNRLANLRWGTDLDNIADMVRNRGLHPNRGERNAHARLTSADVLSVRRRVAHGETQASIAREYGVTITCIHRLVHRQTWAHV